MKKYSIVIISFTTTLYASFWLGGYIHSQNKEIHTHEKGYFHSTDLAVQPSIEITDAKKSPVNNSENDSSAASIATLSLDKPGDRHEHAENNISNPNIDKATLTPSPFDVLPIIDPLQSEHTNLVDPSVQGDEHVFSSQNVDPDWAFATETAIWTAFDEANIERSTMESLECRETLCKIEVIHVDASARAVFLEKLIARPDTYRGTVLQYENELGHPATRLYSYR